MRWSTRPVPERGGSRHDAMIRADCFVLRDAVSWAGIAAWWRLASGSFGARLLRCKGIVEIRDTGEIVFLQAVARVFHSPEHLGEWPDADHRSRLVCITRGVDVGQLQATLAAFDLDADGDPWAFQPSNPAEGVAS
jgi:G3E family GTPase